MPLKCHRCATYSQLVHVHISHNHISIYTLYLLNTINNVTTSNGIHTFQINDISFWPNMPATLCVYVCPTAFKLHITVYTSKTNKSVCCELSCNMQMYYAFGNHIYSLSSMTTYIFLAWQTYFIFCINTNNIENCSHMCIMPRKFWQPQPFYICMPYLFFHIYDPFCIRCLEVILVSCKYLQSFYKNSQIFIPYFKAIFVL